MGQKPYSDGYKDRNVTMRAEKFSMEGLLEVRKIGTNVESRMAAELLDNRFAWQMLRGMLEGTLKKEQVIAAINNMLDGTFDRYPRTGDEGIDFAAMKQDMESESDESE